MQTEANCGGGRNHQMVERIRFSNISIVKLLKLNFFARWLLNSKFSISKFELLEQNYFKNLFDNFQFHLSILVSRTSISNAHQLQDRKAGEVDRKFILVIISNSRL